MPMHAGVGADAGDSAEAGDDEAGNCKASKGTNVRSSGRAVAEKKNKEAMVSFTFCFFPISI